MPLPFKRRPPRRLWTPADAPGLWLALDASVLGSITKDGSNLVSQWDCRYPSRIAAVVQATGSRQPTYSATGLNSLYPAVTFDGTSDILGATQAGLYAFGSATAFMLQRAPSSVLSGHALSEHQQVSATPIYSIMRVRSSVATQGVMSIRDDASATPLSVTANIPGDVNVWTSSIGLWGHTDIGTAINPRLNGVAGTGLTYTRGSTVTVDATMIGAGNWAGPASFQAMETSLIFAWLGALSDSDAQKFEGWVQRHPTYGAAITLPADHPYRYDAPRV